MLILSLPTRPDGVLRFSFRMPLPTLTAYGSDVRAVRVRLDAQLPPTTTLVLRVTQLAVTGGSRLFPLWRTNFSSELGRGLIGVLAGVLTVTGRFSNFFFPFLVFALPHFLPPQAAAST